MSSAWAQAVNTAKTAGEGAASPSPAPSVPIETEALTRAAIRELLDERGIPYRAKDTRAELLELLIDR